MSALTKILIVLQLVFSLVLSTMLVLFVSKEDPSKSMLDSANSKNLALAATVTKLQATVQDLGNKNAAAEQTAKTAVNDADKAINDQNAAAARDQATILELKNQIAALDSKVSSLSSALSTGNSTNAALLAELDKLRPQVADLTTKYNDVYRAKREVDNQLAAAEQAIRKLQEQIASANSAAGNGAMGSMASNSTADGHVQTMVASTPKTVNSKITRVDEDAGRQVILLPLGTRDGIQKNTKLFVYRANGFVADAVVDTVAPDQCVAIVTNTKEGESVQPNDLVSTLAK
ncbi:MAG TPA: hypothetical protein VGN88_01035 [Phycisphaerae bacterium]